MNIKELIQELKSLDDNLQVLVWDSSDSYNYANILSKENIEINNNELVLGVPK